MKFIFKIFFLIIISLLFVYIPIYTKYVPDLYVFVQYAVNDSIYRTITLESFSGNNFLFDLLILLGDFIGISDFTGWIILILSVSYIYFLFKYSYLLFTGRIFAVLIVYLSSFFVDLNQLRFNYGMLCLFLLFYFNSSKLKFVFSIFSFFSHFIPFMLNVLTYARLNFGKFLFLIIPVFSILIFSGFFILFSESRLLAYGVVDPNSKYPKILILFFPVLYYLMYKKVKTSFFINIKNFTTTVFILGCILFFYNFEISARFFEVSFINITILNVYFKKSTLFDIFLFLLSCSILISRLFNGINNSSNFIDNFQI